MRLDLNSSREKIDEIHSQPLFYKELQIDERVPKKCIQRWGADAKYNAIMAYLRIVALGFCAWRTGDGANERYRRIKDVIEDLITIHELLCRMNEEHLEKGSNLHQYCAA